MDIIERIHEEEELDLLFIQEEMNEMEQTIISESLGANHSVELNEDTGELTLLDSERGVTLSPLQVLVLEGFLSQHDKTIFRCAFVPVNEQA